MNALVAPVRASFWWLVPAVLLAVAVGWETGWGRALRKSLPADEPVISKPVETALLPEYDIAGGVAARTETTSRTLFNPTRRPAPAGPQDGANARMQRGQFTLTGTLVADGKSTAFLRETGGSKASRRVQQGQSINGMLVADVRPDRVKLTLGEEAEELVLKVATNPRPTPQPVAAAPGPAGAAPVAQARAGAAPAAQAGQAAAPAAMPQGIPQSLAERRRAARAAEAAAGAAQGTTPTPAPATTPAATTTGGAAPAAEVIDPRWEQMDRAYRERAAQRRN
jgi:hypothetical protein